MRPSWRVGKCRRQQLAPSMSLRTMRLAIRIHYILQLLHLWRRGHWAVLRSLLNFETQSGKSLPDAHFAVGMWGEWFDYGLCGVYITRNDGFQQNCHQQSKIGESHLSGRPCVKETRTSKTFPQLWRVVQRGAINLGRTICSASNLRSTSGMTEDGRTTQRKWFQLGCTTIYWPCIPNATKYHRCITYRITLVASCRRIGRWVDIRVEAKQTFLHPQRLVIPVLSTSCWNSSSRHWSNLYVTLQLWCIRTVGMHL